MLDTTLESLQPVPILVYLDKYHLPLSLLLTIVYREVVTLSVNHSR